MNRGFKGAFLVAGLFAAGCGGSSSSNPDGIAEGFMGHWEIEGSTTSFTLTCPNTLGPAISFPLWSEIVLDHGVLSDLTDISNACSSPGMSLNSDSKGLVASVVNPDPYTGNAPLCHWVLFPDQNGYPVYTDLTFTTLTATKLQATSTDKAPRILWAGTATGPLMADDGTMSGTSAQVDSCTYTGTGDIFDRTTQP